MKIKKPTTRDVGMGFLAVCMLCFLLLMHSVMYPPDRLIEYQIKRRGYATEGLTVEQISFWRGIYRSSVVVVDEDGREIELWQIAVMPGTQTVSYARPYFEPETE